MGKGKAKIAVIHPCIAQQFRQKLFTWEPAALGLLHLHSEHRGQQQIIPKNGQHEACNASWPFSGHPK